jgi:PST family polysaccharide transporter
MGAESLGIYSRAYSLMLIPITQVISIVSNVMFPALSLIQSDKVRVKRIYLSVMQVLAFITFPLMIGLLATADNFVIGIFGKKWVEVIPLIQILAFVGVLQTLANPTGWIYTSQGKTNWMFWWGVFGSGSVIISIVIGVIIGSIYSVAIAYLIINIILIYPVIRIPGKLIDMTFTEVVKKVFPIFITSLIMAAVVYFVGAILPAGIQESVKLITQVIIGMIIYLSIMWYFKIESFTNVKALMVEQFNNYYKDKSPQVNKES